MKASITVYILDFLVSFTVNQALTSMADWAPNIFFQESIVIEYWSLIKAYQNFEIAKEVELGNWDHVTYISECSSA
jgi:hypothetical protein